LIVNTDTKVTYLGDGSTTAFPITFKFSDASHVKLSLYNTATERETRITSDYYVDAESSVLYYPGYPSGQEPAEALQPSVVPTGIKVVIYRETPITQLVDMGEKYPLPILEAVNDKLTFISQEMSEKIDRSIKVNMSSTETADELFARLFQAADDAEESAGDASDSADAAAASETNAGTSEDNAEIWAEGTDTQVTALGGTHSAKVWALSTDFDTKLATHNTSTTAHANQFTCPISDWVSGTTYALKDIRIHDGKIYQCTTANSDAEFDTDKWQNIGGGAGAAVGDIKAIAYNGDIEEGWLLCNGASVLRTMYPDLFTAIGTTYGSVDSTHFNLPNYTGRFIEGSTTAGTTKEAGLPNITGVINASSQNYGTTGAISHVNEVGSSNIGLSYATNMTGGLTFDASLSSAIYGNSTTVQPPSVTVRYIIKAFDGQTADSALVDITQYENELNNKQDKLADTVDYVVDSYSDTDGNWYRVYKSGWVEQGGYAENSSNVSVTLMKEYASAKYTVVATAAKGYSTYIIANAKTSTYFTIGVNANNMGFYWHCAGQGATE